MEWIILWYKKAKTPIIKPIKYLNMLFEIVIHKTLSLLVVTYMINFFEFSIFYFLSHI